MIQFCDKNFLLTTETAKTLFQTVAGLPVIDLHSGLSAQEIAENRSFDNITRIWLDGDQEKMQAMKAMGIDEYYTTQEAGDYEKFQKWAETVPYLLGNPLYHRTHLELQRYFNIFEPLSPANAEQVWNRANRVICGNSYTVFDLLKKFNVETVCTLENPVSDLFWHQKLAEEGICPAKVLPTFCADALLEIHSPDFSDWIGQLGAVCSQEIENYATLLVCLTERLLFFKSVGGKTAYHAISVVPSQSATIEEADAVFQKAKRNLPLTLEEIACYQAHLLSFLTKKYQDYGFSMEIHTESESVAFSVIALMEKVAKEHKLPKTVLVPKDSSDADALAKRILQSEIAETLRMGGCEGLSYQKIAIKKMLKAVAKGGVLPLFQGFLAESGGLLSYPSHEYFRRVLCDFLGNLVESGEYPNYADLLKKFAKDIAYENTKNYFGL